MEKAPAHLIEDHLDLVGKIVHDLARGFPPHTDRGELAQAGVLGLVEAAKRFDANRGTPFKSFASARIRGAILDAARAADWAPRSVRRAARSLEAAQQSLVSRLGRSPSAAELAIELGVTEQQVKRTQEEFGRSLVLSLDQPFGGRSAEREDFMRDRIHDRTAGDTFDDLELMELHECVRDAVAALPGLSGTVIADLYLAGLSANDVAEKVGLTPSRICQIKKAALVTLRRKINAQYSDRVGPRHTSRTKQNTSAMTRANSRSCPRQLSDAA